MNEFPAHNEGDGQQWVLVIAFGSIYITSSGLGQQFRPADTLGPGLSILAFRVPEPPSVSLVCMALAGFAALRRRS